MEKAYKLRIYPNKNQKKLIHKTFGCTRFVYNYYLAKRKEVYENEGKLFSFVQCSNDMTKLKSENVWLKEVDSVSLQQALRDLDKSYKNFFRDKSVGYPKFKSKKNHKYSYRTNYTNGNIEFLNRHIKLPKLGWIKTRDKQIPQGRILNATILQEPSGKYYVSICCTDVDIKPLPKTDKQIGIDLGIANFCTYSDGDKEPKSEYLQKSLVKIQKLQRELSRKTRGSSNWNKNRIKLAKAYEKISNQKMDYLQQLSTRLIRSYDVICIEDLSIKDMIESTEGSNKIKANRRKSIADCSWYEFTRQLDYKAKWYGKEIKKVDRYYPSSQICHICGYKNPKIKDESIREWDCPCCGTHHDRDINAAINILQSA